DATPRVRRHASRLPRPPALHRQERAPPSGRHRMRLVRRDRNHKEIADALMAAGCSVWDAAHVGGGFPDLVVGRVVAGGRRRTYLLEVKDGTLPPSRRAL